jgi:hypothetical protein
MGARAARRGQERARRRRVRAQRRAVAAALVVLVACGLLIALGVFSSGSSRAPAAVAARTVGHYADASAVARPASGAPHAAAQRASRRTPDPGALPQTDALPSAHSALFHSLMADLWAGVVSGSARRALPAFFPRRAYMQLKAIGNASADWEGRLVRDFALDVGAAHRLLGAGAASATLLGVDVHESYAHWVPPGVCYNALGYYEVPNARVVYRQAGRTRSFGIASMISWRGEWYVVHMGAVLRSSEGGVVDQPESGPGFSEYSGTC